MRRLLVLLLIFALLAPALPVKAETSYYALSFDGEDDYVELPALLNDGNDWSAIVGFKMNSLNSKQHILVNYFSGNGILILSNNIMRVSVMQDDGAAKVLDLTTAETGKTYVVAFSVKSAQYFRAFLDGEFLGEQQLTNNTGYLTGNPFIIAKRANVNQEYANVDVYFVLIYSRALSDLEIQNIYNDPTNPPTDGLVLWLAPDSVDTANDIWTDKSGQGNDGTIYGATAERVSIPKLYVYDANTSEQISYMNVSLTLYFNNTTTGLIPSLPILPWNETVTLNISAVNYESASLSTWSGVDLISVYLEPANVTTNITKLTKLVNPTPPQELGTYAFNISDINTEFSKLFTGATGWALAMIFVMGLTVASLKFHQKPAVTAAVAGASIVYLGTWINANWSILWLLMAMLMSATILRIFGRYQK